MEKAVACSSLSFNWPPPEFENAKRFLLACLRLVRNCVRAVWVVLFVVPPEQERINESRARVRQQFPQM